ncbi:uncharacterized protein F5147DRAFT_766906 [Suillus discolor]|uniref:Fungal-type protein kinase domain-containing protein n=1 Tax=Suillus discolor TaxID=1912936 RepID=A0A9P7K2J1_9AGAM|nr:uncharacterized protein F5147DRAFT_766906 [Suillus discolor]KAG2121042.1 hypothetical protein F5147DRAFT_766906 [Suillus discolor]
MELMFGANGNIVEHRACDDLESFFWILWIMSVNYDGPFNVTRDWADIEHLVTKLATEEDNSTVDLHNTKFSQHVQLREESVPLIGAQVPGYTSWMKDMFPTTTISTPVTTTPPPISTSASTSNPAPVETVAQRLHKGLRAQHKFVRDMWKHQLIDNKKAHLYCVGDFTSLNVPAWAKPGGHVMEYCEVAMEKVTMSWEMMKALITLYFAKPPFLEGMERLHSLFKGITSTREGKVFWTPPQHVPTHDKVTCILEDMLESIKGYDTYTDALQIKDGRQRYEEFLRHGHFPSFPTVTVVENKRKRSLKVAGNLNRSSNSIALGSMVTPASIVSCASKRGVESLELMNGGGPPQKNPCTK